MSMHSSVLAATVVAAFAAQLLPGQPQAATIGFTVSDNAIYVGESFTIDVVAQDLFAGLALGEELVGFGFDYTVSPASVLGAQGFTITPLLADPYTDLSPLIGAEVAAVAGASPVANGGALVDLVLARFSFDALAAGMGELSVSAVLTNLDQGLRFLDLTGDQGFTGSVQIDVREAAAPLPGTALLLVAGLLGLVRHRP